MSQLKTLNSPKFRSTKLKPNTIITINNTNYYITPNFIQHINQYTSRFFIKYKSDFKSIINSSIIYNHSNPQHQASYPKASKKHNTKYSHTTKFISTQHNILLQTIYSPQNNYHIPITYFELSTQNYNNLF